MSNLTNFREILDIISKANSITKQQLENNRNKLMTQRWFVLLDPDFAEQQAETIKFFMKTVFNLEVSYANNVKGFTNVDSGGYRYNHVMWTAGTLSPKCSVYNYTSFLVFIFALANLKYNDKIDSIATEIQKLTKELEEKIVEIDKAAQNMKNKLEENHKKQIDFLLDSIGSLE